MTEDQTTGNAFTQFIMPIFIYGIVFLVIPKSPLADSPGAINSQESGSHIALPSSNPAPSASSPFHLFQDGDKMSPRQSASEENVKTVKPSELDGFTAHKPTKLIVSAISQGELANATNSILQSVSGEDFAKADTLLQKLSDLPKLVPGNDTAAEALNKEGVVKMNARDYSGAVASLTNACVENPTVPKYLSNLGYAEMYGRNFEAALKHTQMSMALSPKRVLTWNNMGQIFARGGDQQNAQACFYLAYRLSKGQSKSYLLGLRTCEDKQVSKAAKAVLASVDLSTSTQSDESASANLLRQNESSSPSESQSNSSGSKKIQGDSAAKQVESSDQNSGSEKLLEELGRRARVRNQADSK